MRFSVVNVIEKINTCCTEIIFLEIRKYTMCPSSTTGICTISFNNVASYFKAL